MLPVDWYDSSISLGEYQTQSEFHISRLDTFWHEARPVAYGAAGMHALPQAIAKLPAEIQLIEISSYRKRILPLEAGRLSRTYLSMRELTVTEAETAKGLAVFVPTNQEGFLVAAPRPFKMSVLKQYAKYHHRKDIIDYISLAVSLGVLEEAEASELLAMRVFIPGGVQLGIYPRAWLVEALRQIGSVSREFLYRYRDRVYGYDNVQVRAVGYLDERLGSYKLIKYFGEKYAGKPPTDLFGYITTIVEQGSKYLPSRGG